MEQESTTLKFCKDCKHSKRDFFFGWQFAKCGAPSISKFDLITGKPLYSSYCEVQRKFKGDCCGPEGTKFVQKEKGWL